MTALAGIQSAISMVKKASKVANDLGSLAPMIGKMFDAKSTATKALIEAQVSTEGKKAAFQLLLQTTGMEIESHDIGTVEENEKGKLVFMAYGTQPAPVMVAVKISDQE